MGYIDVCVLLKRGGGYFRENTVHAFTIALYFEATALASVDLPLIGGPSTQTLQGIFGFGGLR